MIEKTIVVLMSIGHDKDDINGDGDGASDKVLCWIRLSFSLFSYILLAKCTSYVNQGV